jgi:hypothetical protein
MIIDDTVTYTNAAMGKAMTHSVPVYTPVRVAKVDIALITLLVVVVGIGPGYSVADVFQVMEFHPVHLTSIFRGSGNTLAINYLISP